MIRFSREGHDYICEAEQWLPRTPERLWRFFADCRHMNHVLPPFIRFYVETPAPAPLAAGAVYDYRLKLHGLPLRWRTRVTEADRPDRFEDVQVKGPYARFAHRHEFVRRDGGTLTRDRIVYRPPGGLLAPLVNRLIVRPDLRRLFAHRHRRMLELYSGAGDPSALLDPQRRDPRRAMPGVVA